MRSCHALVGGSPSRARHRGLVDSRRRLRGGQRRPRESRPGLGEGRPRLGSTATETRRESSDMRGASSEMLGGSTEAPSDAGHHVAKRQRRLGAGRRRPAPGRARHRRPSTETGASCLDATARSLAGIPFSTPRPTSDQPHGVHPPRTDERLVTSASARRAAPCGGRPPDRRPSQ